MYEPCVNTILTDKYYEELDKQSDAQERFFNEIEPYLVQIAELVDTVKAVERKYESYDFEDFLKECIEDVL